MHAYEASSYSMSVNASSLSQECFSVAYFLPCMTMMLLRWDARLSGKQVQRERQDIQHGSSMFLGDIFAAVRDHFLMLLRWDAHVSGKQLQRMRKRDQLESGMILDDMFAVLDRDKKGFVTISNVLQFMYKNKDRSQLERMRKLVPAKLVVHLAQQFL